MYGVSVILVSGYPSVSSTEIFTTADGLQHMNQMTMQVHQWCCEEIFHTPTLTIGKKFPHPHFTPILGLLSIYQHKQDVFGWIYINR